MKILLGNNTGLGDYILMNGAARYNAAQEGVERVDILCVADHNKFKQIERMYRDNPKITVHGEPEARNWQNLRRKARQIAKKFKGFENRIFFWESCKWIPAMPLYKLDPVKNCWPELFYSAHKAPFSARHEHFYIERDRDREDELFKELNLPTDYAFCVDQGKRPKFNLTPKTNLCLFKPHHRADLFGKYYIWDWMKVVEKAKEIYTVDTSWLHFLKSMRLEQPKYYYHVRSSHAQNVFTSCYINDEYDNGWQIIDKHGHLWRNQA